MPSPLRMLLLVGMIAVILIMSVLGDDEVESSSFVLGRECGVSLRYCESILR